MLDIIWQPILTQQQKKAYIGILNIYIYIYIYYRPKVSVHPELFP